jgi:hypothetical protein
MDLMKSHIYAARKAAERAIAAIDAARNPDGTEEVTLPDGTREIRPAKTWAFPLELEDGRWAVTWEDRRLGPIAEREVTVGNGQRVRVPRAEDVEELEIEEQPDGRVIVRAKGRRTEEE